MWIGKVRTEGVNFDGIICQVPNVRTLMCLNQFCGYSLAEEMDEVILRRCVIPVQCPKCGVDLVKIVSYTPNPPEGRKKLPKRRNSVAKTVRYRAA